MNPPERHLTAVPDVPTSQRRGKSKTLEDARAAGEVMPAPWSDPEHDVEADFRAGMSAAMLEEARVIGEVPVVADRQRTFDQAKRARAALARTKPAPGPHADAHTRGYRRGGKRRKRELAAERAIMAEGLTVVREVRQAARRAQRAARA